MVDHTQLIFVWLSLGLLITGSDLCKGSPAMQNLHRSHKTGHILLTEINIPQKEVHSGLKEASSSLKEIFTRQGPLYTRPTEVHANPRKKDPCPLQCACETKTISFRESLSVSCSRANFTQIPRIPHSSADVIIRRSSVYHIQEYAFDELTELINLRIESKVPWTVSEKAFWNIKNIQTLYLEGNSPHMKPLPPQVFKKLSTLNLLTVLHIPIDIESDMLCPLSELSYLRMQYNAMTRLKFAECFLKFRRLSLLFISNNPLIKIEKEDLDNLRNSPLLSLTLIGCKFKALEDDIFLALPHLTSLSLSKNGLQTLSIPHKDTNIKNIDISANSFTLLPCGTLARMPKLVKLISVDNKHMKVTMCECFKNLTSLSELQLDGTPIDFIGDDFFKMLETTPVKTLSLTTRKVSPKSFSYLKQLNSLKFSSRLTSKTLSEGLTSLSETNITKLLIRETRPLGVLGSDIFDALRSTKLTTLKIITCRIREVSKSTFSGLLYLAEINLHDNSITYLPDGVFEGLTSLRILDLSKNNILTWGGGYIPWGIEPNVQRITLGWNSIKTIPAKLFRQPVNLSSLVLGHNQIRTIAPHAFQGTQLSSLSLNNNHIVMLQNGLLDHCINLQRLDLSTNKLTFDESMDYNPFEKLARLKYLSISAAAFPDQYQRIGNVFINLRKLTFLSVSNSGLTQLPTGMFVNTSNLESLVLTRNSIMTWEPELFEPLNKLIWLSLAKNKITNVNKGSFMYLRSLRKLDLSSNSLVCNCDLLWFRSWISNAYIYLDNIQEAGKYVCAAPDDVKGTSLLHFNLSEDDCIDKTILKLSISLAITAAMVACLSFVGYKYRFHLHYVYFYVRSRRQRLLEAQDDTQYVYDAFVAYSSEDGAWVVRKLLPELEYERGYKLCVHHRDWLAGKDIVDNILTSIESSRKVILVLSNKFASSQWCQVEATMSHTRMLDGGRNPLILLLLEDINSKNMTSTLRYLMTSQTYLPWSIEEQEQKMFWRRLSTAMKGPRGRRGILYREALIDGSQGEYDLNIGDE